MCKYANELIRNSIERRVTRSMKKLISREEQSINAINTLKIPESDHQAIALKLHQSIQLTQSEKKYWNNFSKSLVICNKYWISRNTKKDTLLVKI